MGSSAVGRVTRDKRGACSRCLKEDHRLTGRVCQVISVNTGEDSRPGVGATCTGDRWWRNWCGLAQPPWKSLK